jgi:hypothetical protein
MQYQLADTEAERKTIALAIFDAEQALLKSKLEAVAASETATAAERARAEAALAAMAASAGGRREAAERASETEVERYLRHLNRTPEQINEAIDGIAIDGLEELNDGLVDAIMNAESLGDVFTNVADQIVRDLLRIAIQRAVIEPLANSLFGGGGSGGGTGGLSASLGQLFSGFFATGGLIPKGTFGIVGERGPEPVIGTDAGAMVLPNSSLRGGFGQAMRVEVVPSPFFDVVVEERAATVAAPMAARASVVGSSDAQSALARRSSRTIP